MMKHRNCFFLFILCTFLLFSSVASASFKFSDDRFQGIFTTENINKIIEEYELFDGWYWTTRARVPQTFHGMENMPGWTDTAVNICHHTAYVHGQYGCRWMANQVTREKAYGTYGECFGFASFVGYLLSGEYNPHHKWEYYYSVKDAGGLKVGDILRVDFYKNNKHYHHSAVVYSVNEKEILFLQVSGSRYNRISVGTGYMDGYHNDPRTIEEFEKMRNLKICRSKINISDTDQ